MIMMLYKCGMMIFSALQKIFVDLGQPAVSRSMLVYLRVQYFPNWTIKYGLGLPAVPLSPFDLSSPWSSSMCRFDLRRHQSNVASAFLLHCWRHCWRGALHYHPTPRWCARFIPYIPYIPCPVRYCSFPFQSAFLTTPHCGPDTIGCCSVPGGCSSPVLFSADFIRVHPFPISDVCQLSMTVVHSCP